MQIVADVDCMNALAVYVAKIARRRPRHALAEEVSDCFPEIGRVAVELGNSAQQVLLSRDPEKAAACAKKTTRWTTCTGSCSPTPRAIVPEKSERVARRHWWRSAG